MTLLLTESLDSYCQGLIELSNCRLKSFSGPSEVAASLAEINAYPNLTRLSAPKTVVYLDNFVGLDGLGAEAALAGRILWEYPAAGEAVRLGLGAKFFLTYERLASLSHQSGLVDVSGAKLALGPRRLNQLVYELSCLSTERRLDIKETLAKQKFLIITSVGSAESIVQLSLKTLEKRVPRENIWFMVQSAFHGLDRASNEAPWDFDINSPLRLHNHGQMVIQKTMDRQIFYLNGAGERVYFSRLEFQERLSEFDDLVSFNIEDLDYLTGALDFRSLGLAVRFATLGRASARLPQGPEPVGMMMEFTANNLTRPVKGGWLVFDELIGRDVAIESFRLKEGGPEIWGYFNKNFNHYPNPSFVFGRLAEKGLFMPVAVADDKVYFQPCQGDLNFLVQTAFVARRSAKALNSLKTPADIPSALQAMSAQDEQPGFLTLFD